MYRFFVILLLLVICNGCALMVAKETAKVEPIDDTPKSPDDAKLKKEGKPYHNKRGVLVTPEGSSEVPFEIEPVAETVEAVPIVPTVPVQPSPPVVPTPPVQEIDMKEVPRDMEQTLKKSNGENYYNKAGELVILQEEVIEDKTITLQERWDNLMKLALDNNIKTAGLLFENQDEASITQLEELVQKRIKK